MSATSQSPGAPSEELTALRNILLRDELQEIDALRERLDDSTLQVQDVSDVLAEAIMLRTREGDALREALLPVMIDGLKLAVEREPKVVADAIYPVIGPAIRKAVAQALRDFTLSTRRTLDLAFSPRGLRWRWQAWRSGRPFSEIVALHTLVYRATEALLVHRPTGIALLNVASEESGTRDPELVSGMLSAIQDFVQDSFGSTDGSLERLEVGSVVVYVERGPSAAIAVVVRGIAEEQALRARMQDALELIHARYSSELADFDGNVEVFENIRPLLEECLVSEHEGDR